MSIVNPGHAVDKPSRSPWTAAALLLVSVLVIMTAAPIAPDLPALEEHFITVPQVEVWINLVLTLPAILIVMASPLAGQLIDRWGRKSLLIGSTLVFGVFGSAGALTDSLLGLLLERAAVGIAVGCVITAAMTLIADTYSEEERPFLMGLQSCCIGLGGFVFSVLGGSLADLDWRAPFTVYLYALILVPFLILALPESNIQHEDQETGVQIPGASRSLKQLLASLLPVYGIEALHMFLFYVTPILLPFYLRSEFDLSLSRAGWALGTLTLAQALTAINYGRVRNHLGFVSVAIVAFCLAGLGYGVIAVAPTYSLVVLGMAVSGLGFGLLFPNSKVWVAQLAPQVYRGRALGGLTTAFYVGEFLSPFASQPLSHSLGISGLYGWISVVMIGLALILLAIRIWTSPPRLA